MYAFVTGANGLLGSVVVRTLREQGHAVVGSYHSEEPTFDCPLHQVDITDTERVVELLDEYDVDLVINCAAYTDVDGCESNPEVATAVNGTAPGDLAAVCDDREIPFIHYSTDYVFDGETDGFYEEGDEPAPIQEYGRSKLTGEHAVRDVNPDALILRLSFVYGARGDTSDLVGFPQWVASTLAAGDTVPLFTDQTMTPSRAGNVATTTLELLDAGVSGTFHVASQSAVTPSDFGEKICEVIGGDATLIESSVMADLDRPAARPRRSCLDVSNVEGELGCSQPTLEDDLAALEAAFSDYSS
ncbi:dTDP-4-dehydrorhamnose reductase [Haloferax volcanii]|uniref:Probable low-salt glycan biosynthesis reductase Agl14 n=2 Tax=Haloferax volcanii TaxID=2246 RepID=AGL14_HALVD|nr:dTDP-4-dehydrorhamnose reductase [Haloferax volcanii]D4GU71.1 RecName: Full=Probable low-salt glycan biosynthesis reductase Agl14 [Haloferax volcanii DS2]ADE02982.1 dTDP-4-dehydrorhamnose reductase [Haloferax volcanii DS2]MBS8119319.1 dTDP-4-dehydrorhamnose reductase [Haloferax volcanii]MBS8124332.1 dTDP-4-dehydrorhamnose reductase [Haloferax volcanii]MBS8128201.1 dTDP-4-dehydrorhamnose reductase [Haloferax volcanii]MBS8132066.1 dTDP-4-dehydrorhamnose reductase [Haloferax volcanii]